MIFVDALTMRISGVASSVWEVQLGCGILKGQAESRVTTLIMQGCVLLRCGICNSDSYRMDGTWNEALFGLGFRFSVQGFWLSIYEFSMVWSQKLHLFLRTL